MFETLTKRLSGSFSLFRGRRELTSDNIQEGLKEVQTALLEADVHFQVARDFCTRVEERALGDQRLTGVEASEQFIHAVHQELVQLMGPEDATITLAKPGPTVILMAGLQGAGKTTTCAKLAVHLREKHNSKILLVAADVKRPAAVEQLRVLGRQIDTAVFHAEGKTPPEVCRLGVAEARRTGADLVILDTAGRLHVDQEMMAEVAEIAALTQPDAQILVADAMTGQDAVRSAEEFHKRLSLTGVILTKLDGDARGGAALSIKQVTGAPILFVGTGEKVADLDAFSAERMAGRILGMGDVVGLVDQAQKHINEDEAQASFEKLVMGTFTLQDMFSMLGMVRKLGPMKKVMGMMPGMGQLGDMDVDERQMDRLEALFHSMTPRERLRPQTLDVARRRRVARGAGQPLAAVNDLMKRYQQMGKAMKKLGKMGMGSMIGGKDKRAALAGMSGTGAMMDPSQGKGGMMGGLGGLLGGAGGGMGAGMPPGMAGMDPSSMMEGANPRGSSATRKSGKDLDKKKREKAKAKARRKNRRKK